MNKEFNKEDLKALSNNEHFAKFIKFVFTNREVVVSKMGEVQSGFSESPEELAGKIHAYQSVLIAADYLNLFDRHKIKLSL